MTDAASWERLLRDSAAERATQPQRICQLCVELLDITGAGIGMVTEEGNHGVVCATDDVSAQIENLQLTLGEGPCVDAVGRGAPVLVDDLGDAGAISLERWPVFLEGARAAGVRAVYAFPLRIGAISLGAMDLYRDRPGELDPDELSAALMAADAAAYALLYLATDAVDGFADDFDARSSYQLQVHQATGMVQVQLGVKTDEALLRLRSRAFVSGRPLVDVASDVVDRRLRFSREDR